MWMNGELILLQAILRLVLSLDDLSYPMSGVSLPFSNQDYGSLGVLKITRIALQRQRQSSLRECLMCLSMVKSAFNSQRAEWESILPSAIAGVALKPTC